MIDPPVENLAPWQWASLMVGFAFVVIVISDVFVRLWRVPETPGLGPAPYDWSEDDHLLDVWAREAEGEVLAVFPANWLYK